MTLWLLALPRTLLVNSAGAYSHAALLAESFAAALVLCAIASLFARTIRKRTEKNRDANQNSNEKESANAKECESMGKSAKEHAEHPAKQRTKQRTEQNTKRSAATLMAGCGAALSTICGLASLFIVEPTTRTALICVQLAAGTPLLTAWGRPLAYLAQRSKWHALLVTCAAFGMAATVHLALDLGGNITDTTTNLLEWTSILLAFLSLLPTTSWLLGRHLFVATTSERLAADEQHERHEQRASNGQGKQSKPLALFATTAFTSLVVSLFGGFTFVAHQFSLVRASLLEYVLLLAVMVLTIALATLRKTEKPRIASKVENANGTKDTSSTKSPQGTQSAEPAKLIRPSEHAAPSEAGSRTTVGEQASLNLLGIPSFCLVIVGMVALNVGIPLSAAVSHGLLQAATDCLLALGMLALAACLPYEGPNRSEVNSETNTRTNSITNPTTWWCLGLLITGLICGPCWGVALRRALGLDAAALTVAATVCVALFAMLYFTQVGLSLGRAFAKASDGNGAFGATATSAPYGSNSMDAKTAREIVARSYREALRARGFSPREAEVASLLLEGYDAAAIADQLNVKLGTVRYHLTNAYRKANVVSKAELVNFVKTELSPEEDSI